MRGRAAASHPAGTGVRGRYAFRRWALCGVLAALPASAFALEFGKLQWRPATKESPAQAEILIQDSAEIDPAGIRARLGVKESYGVAGLTYLPAFASVQVKPQQRPEGGVVLKLEGLPADVPSLDLLVTVHYKLKMTLAEFRVDLRRGAVEVPPMPAGSQMAGVASAPQAPARGQAEPAAAALQPIATAGARARPQLAAHSLAAPAVAATSPATLAPAAAPSGAATPLAGARAALQAWAEAWSRRDVEGYLSAYSPEHVGRGAPTAAAWREQRRSRIEARKKIEVQLSAMEFKAEGDRVLATFTQSYRADGLRETVRKRMLLAQTGGRWLINEESELR